jgi:hypothetical protein
LKAWLTIPSARPLAQLEPVLQHWKDMGYGIALVRQGEETHLADVQVLVPEYCGWARSINALCARVFGSDREALWCVGGGDDTLPDPAKHADRIASECCRHFGVGGPLDEFVSVRGENISPTFGVMQPTGDLWSDSKGIIIERFAGSPWIGRDWAWRAYGGNGPLYEGYKHNWADEELQNVAIKYGAFWQRPDLCQRHVHWQRAGVERARPAYAQMIADDYKVSKPLFEQRQADGWPGSEPIQDIPVRQA